MKLNNILKIWWHKNPKLNNHVVNIYYKGQHFSFLKAHKIFIIQRCPKFSLLYLFVFSYLFNTSMLWFPHDEGNWDKKRVTHALSLIYLFITFNFLLLIKKLISMHSICTITKLSLSFYKITKPPFLIVLLCFSFYRNIFIFLLWYSMQTQINLDRIHSVVVVPAER